MQSNSHKYNYLWCLRNPSRIRIGSSVAATLKCSQKIIDFDLPPVRTLKDMSEEEIVALERHYGVPVIRPS